MDHTVLDFLAEGCIAGQTLLRMVARGNAIIAEVPSFVPLRNTKTNNTNKTNKTNKTNNTKMRDSNQGSC
jgi:hypothetical protein